ACVLLRYLQEFRAFPYTTLFRSAGTAVPGRADQRGGPGVAARLLGQAVRTRRCRHHAAGVHPLHGRSRALPPARDPRPRAPGGRRQPRCIDRRAARTHVRSGLGAAAARAGGPARTGRRAQRGPDRQQRARARRGRHRWRRGAAPLPRGAAGHGRPRGTGDAQSRGRVRRRHPRGAGGGRAMSWRRLWAIMLKEVRQLRRDRMTLAMILGIPVLQLVLFGYAINLNLRGLDVAIADQANTTGSRALVMDMLATGVVTPVADASTPAELMAMLERGEISVGIVIPPDFERRRIDGREVAQVLVD